jgi:glycosyltransferase involved in cell wall biosynthesis
VKLQLKNGKGVIAVCNTQVPFTTGGAELLVETLINYLKRRGHEVVLISIPFSFSPFSSTILSSIVWRMIEIKDITGRIPDLVITTRFPTYLVKHPNKIAWLFHQHRAAYDLFDTDHSDFKNNAEGKYYRDLIKTMDDNTLTETKKIFTISRNVTKRLKHFNGINSETLYVPPLFSKDLRSGPYEDYVLSVGRLTGMKRVDLLLRALVHTDPTIKAVIVGEGDQEENLKKLASDLGVAGRVDFKGFVPEDELIALYAGSFAVVFPPVDEDLGLIAIEAFKSQKPVITCVDSGGPLEFVEDGMSGFVCQPDEKEIAEKLDLLLADKEKCRSFGQVGLDRVRDITWDNVIKRFESFL